MAIRELDSDNSLCKNAKMTIIMVHLDSIGGLEEYAEYDLVIPVEIVKEVFGDSWEQFLKRNRLNDEQELVYLEKVKRKADREALIPRAEKRYTGWLIMKDLPPEVREEVISRKGNEDVLTEWDMLSFDEMNETCASCPLSWDKGRGCIGTFGPGNSLLPDMAKRHSCDIIAGAPEAVAEGSVFSPEDARRLLDEVELLREKLPEEGKMMVRRYSGVLERLERLAQVCSKHETRFYFI